MKIAVTGATGFLGRSIVGRLAAAGHECRCWRRSGSRIEVLSDLDGPLDWVLGDLDDGRDEMMRFVEGCDALVHAALDRPGKTFRGGEGELETFVTRNVVGSLRLFEAARRTNVARTIFISTCAVHEKILDNRPLNETHPLWPTTHYGAHKAALEAFVASYGMGYEFSICSLRPCGIYGLADPLEASKWYDIVRSIVRGEIVECQGGGKVVHADDVAQAVDLLCNAEGVDGEAYNCCDQYVSQWDVATIARELSGSNAEIRGATKTPMHQIDSSKLIELGMNFGGRRLLTETLSQLIKYVREATEF